MSKVRDLLRRTGPRPVLLVQLVGARAARKVRRRALRRAYSGVRTPGRTRARLELPRIDVGTATSLPEPLRAAAERLREEADGLLQGRVCYLGSGLVDIGHEVDWHADFKSGYRWPRDFYADVEVTRLDDESDAKVPWELSRGHQMLTLARAARLFADDRYADELERLLWSWLRENPVGRGINWVNPMEVAIRAVNWIWAAAVVEPHRPLSPELRRALAGALEEHAHHIRLNLEGSPLLRSNHYLADVLGLFVIGSSVRGPRAALWRTMGQLALEREMRRQVRPDGMAFEASTAYHGLDLEMFLVAVAAGRARGTRFSAGFQERLRRMLAFSSAIRHPNGDVPLFGDNDSGRILPGGFGRTPTHDNLIWLGVALDVPGAPGLEGEPHEEVAWTLGLEAWERARGRAGAPAQASRAAAFEASGIWVSEGPGSKLVIRCGDVGQAGNGGHAHNDALSFELSLDGRPAVVDPGTAIYTADPARRDADRSTRAHNTVRLDGDEINPLPPGSLFTLPQHAAPVAEGWAVEGDRCTFTGSHDGWLRLDGAGVHRRVITHDRAAGEITVRDEVGGDGRHLVESFLHLAPGWEARAEGAAVHVRSGDRAFTVEAIGAVDVELVPDQVSREYGASAASVTIVASARGTLPAELGWRILARLP